MNRAVRIGTCVGRDVRAEREPGITTELLNQLEAEEEALVNSLSRKLEKVGKQMCRKLSS